MIERAHTLMFLSAALLAFACSGSHGLGADAGPRADAPATLDASGSGDYAGAYLSPECAPDDGPALRLTLFDVAVPECSADTSARSLSFYLFSGTDDIFPITAPVTITSSSAGGGLGNGSATECPGGSPPCRSSQDWSLTFETFTQDVGATGTYAITFADGSSASGRFDASWCSFAPPTCG